MKPPAGGKSVTERRFVVCGKEAPQGRIQGQKGGEGLS